jgi:hypothetical protein
VAGRARHADRLGAGGREVKGVEVCFGHRAVEADGLVGHRKRQGDGVVGPDEAEFAGGGGDTGLAPAVYGVHGGGLGRRADRDAQVDVTQVADRTGEFEFVGLAAQVFGVVEEFRSWSGSPRKSPTTAAKQPSGSATQ